MKQSKKFLSLALALVMTLSLAAPAMAAEETKTEDGKITILYTNDVHTYINNTRQEGEGDEAVTVPGLRYSTIAGYKAQVGADFLVDAGDHIQGTVFGSVDSGETIIKLMNATGYTASTLGNHEFDYDMPRILELIDMAEYDYVSCNILNVDGTQLLDSFKVYTAANGKTVAFVGFTTPETITKSTPKYFMDENGNIVWNFAEGDEGAKLYATAQAAIDAAAAEADYVIGVGHMGVDESSAPYTSEDIIANTTGLTAFIDGHSHTTMEMKEVADKEGNTIILTQTGCYLAALGEMTIAADGSVTTKLLSAEDLAEVEPDADVAAIEDAFIAKVDEEMNQVISVAEVNLDINNAAGERAVRKEETNIGNFCADAFYTYFDTRGYEVDIAIMNGGGIRASLNGEITDMVLQNVFPWGNVLCLVDLTGQQILDALEWSAQAANLEGTAESGGFLSTSGLIYTINLAIPSTVQADDAGIWIGGPTGEYRVCDVQVLNRESGEYEPLDLDAHYAVAGINYTLRSMGDGFNMFEGENIVDGVAVDYMALSEYVQSFPVDEETGLPTIKQGMGYDEDVKMGRITLVNHPADLAEGEWWYDVAVWALDTKVMNGTEKGFEPNAEVTRASVLQTLYNNEGKPAVEAVLTDVEGQWYADAANWAVANGLIEGTEFGADAPIARGDIKDLLEAYGELLGNDYSNLMKGNEHGDLMLEETVDRAQYAQLLKNMADATPVVTE